MAEESEWGAGLWGLADLATPMAVRVAAILRIADHIARGLRTAPELAEAVNADADALKRVLGHLTTAGVLSDDGPDQYALTARGEALRDDYPVGVRRMLDIETAIGRADLSFVQLLYSVRTGMDLRMLAYFGGRERGVAELTALASASGLSVAAVHPAGASSILVLTARQ